MKTLSILAPGQEVIARLERTLVQRKYRRVLVNYDTGEITAGKKSSFFWWRDHLRFKVKPVNDEVTNVELTVNPHRGMPSSSDETKELELGNQFFFYL